SIFVSCGLLLAVYELGRTLEDWPLGLTGAFVCGTTGMFLKFCWQAEYDLHLALWVIVTNWCLALATFKDRRWFGCIGAGIGLGLALMSKGFPAIAQTLIPWAAYLAWRKWRWKIPAGRGWLAPSAIGLALLLVVALPWTIYAFYVNHHMLHTMYSEVTLRLEASYETRVRWHSYIVFFPLMLPWLIWFCSGFIEIVRRGRTCEKMWLALFLLVLPIAIAQPFPERRDRYLLPMVGPAALIAAYGVLRHVPRWRQWTSGQALLVAIQGIGVIVFAAGLPIWGHLRLKTVDGQPWYDLATTLLFCAMSLAIGTAALLVYRKTRIGFIGGTVGLMLLTNLVFLSGYRNSSNGRSDGKLLAEQILSAYPNALIYNAAPKIRPVLPLELLIYLDRDVPSLRRPAALARADRPQVLVYPPSADGVPPVAPPGFREFAEQKINTGMFHVFVRE
ncbi:MAG TPA: hypothetical protein VL992_12105, partial [Tepidisphaeraceae bacterium]|nr:hypothetical protein [Tepidisphaeraceae bacterium]